MPESEGSNEAVTLRATSVTARDRADWDRIAVVYGQCIGVLQDEQPYLPPTMAAFLAELLARISSSYYGDEQQLVVDAFEVFCEVEDRARSATTFRELYADSRFLTLHSYSPHDGSRRRPTPFEATVETARRLRDLNLLEKSLSAHTIGAVLGGSASYGRFYNVIGNRGGDRAASDLDLLIVVDQYEDLRQVSTALEDVTSIDRQGLETFSARIDEFLRDGVPGEFGQVMFSGKIGLWSGLQDPIYSDSAILPQYDVSLHICTDDVFRRVILRDTPRISRGTLGESQAVYDYRESVPSRTDHQRNLAGGNLRLGLEAQPIGTSFLRSSYLFYIDERDQYYPGMFQNLVLPNFDLRWGATELRRSVESFRWKMIERLRFESRTRPHDFLRISYSHTRSQMFAPHTVRSVDNSTLLP